MNRPSSASLAPEFFDYADYQLEKISAPPPQEDGECSHVIDLSAIVAMKGVLRVLANKDTVFPHFSPVEMGVLQRSGRRRLDSST